MSSRWWLHGSLVVAALTVGGLSGCGGHGDNPVAADSKKEGEGEEHGEAHVVVRTELARKGTVEDTVEGLGRCESLPDQLATLTPAVQGNVETLLVKEGDSVKKGQPIVELDKVVALADLAEKAAARDSLVATLNLLKSVPRREERRANELAIETAKVTVERTQRIAERLRPLLAQKQVSEQQVYEADQAAVQAKLQQDTAEAQLKVMMMPPREEALAEAKAKIATAEAAVAFSKAHLDFHTIRSPIDGVLDSLTCHPGQSIAIGASIGEVVDTRQIFATVWLPPRKAHLVRVGQPAHLLPADSGLDAPAEPSDEAEKKDQGDEKDHAEKKDPPERKENAETKAEPEKKDEADKEGKDEKKEPETIEGKVEFVGQVADAQTGNLPVRVLVENADGHLSLGQTVAVTITIEQHEGVLQVPAAAILDQGEGPLLNVIREGKTVVLHPEVGAARNGWVAVSGTDLKEGDAVIVEGGYNLPEGTEVKVEGAKEETSKDEPAKDESSKEAPAKAKAEKEAGKESAAEERR
ncbi:MAG TPA: efflux RND transporter periplasmic adaptor subunit [Isosphaeraceae bacterium]|jgi:RND family efflux transporter MFP subunit|nr:efflux RND transporter periplasmic adaptor subunit [Isosphaeraceae bacterium]